MITATFKCFSCNKVFEELLDDSSVKELECPYCKEKAYRGYWTSKSCPNVLVKNKNRSSPKIEKDGGVPIGELPGDDDYNWQKQGCKWGPTP